MYIRFYFLKFFKMLKITRKYTNRLKTRIKLENEASTEKSE